MQGEREALLRESKTSLHKAVKIGGDDETIAHLRKLAKTAKRWTAPYIVENARAPKPPHLRMSQTVACRYGLDLGRFRIPKRVKPESDCSDTLLRIEVTTDAREDGRIGPELHQQALKVAPGGKIIYNMRPCIFSIENHCGNIQGGT
jgi:hypothetical protein